MSAKPLLFMSKIFGLLPLSFSELDICNRGAFSFRISDVGFLLMWILALLTLLGLNLQQAIYSFTSYPEKIKITFVVYALVFPLTKIFVIITTNFINIGNISKLFKKFLEIDQFIDRRSRMRIYEKIRVRSLKTGAFVFVTQIILYSIEYYVCTEVTLIRILRTTTENLCITFYVMLCVQYVSILQMLKCRYEYFNDMILKYFKKESTANEPISKHKNMPLSVNIDYIELPTLCGRKLTRTAMALNGRHEINNLRMIYLNIYDSVTLINSYFGIPVLLELVSMTTMCVTALYYAVYILDCDSGTSGETLRTYMTSCLLILCCILYASLFAWLIICCHNTTQEANRGIYHIHKISLDRDIHYSTVTELDRLLSQLINMKVQFTVCGLFALNLPFLCTLFSGIITYIVIIVQLS